MPRSRPWRRPPRAPPRAPRAAPRTVARSVARLTEARDDAGHLQQRLLDPRRRRRRRSCRRSAARWRQNGGRRDAGVHVRLLRCGEWSCSLAPMFWVPIMGMSSSRRQATRGSKVFRRCGLTFQRSERRDIPTRSIPQELRMIAFEVNDMTCGHCVRTITQAMKGHRPGRQGRDRPRQASRRDRARRLRCAGARRRDQRSGLHAASGVARGRAAASASIRRTPRKQPRKARHDASPDPRPARPDAGARRAADAHAHARRGTQALPRAARLHAARAAPSGRGARAAGRGPARRDPAAADPPARCGRGCARCRCSSTTTAAAG